MCHLIDTALVARELLPLLLGPRCLAVLRTAFRPLGDVDDWIALMCGIHDLGKYSPAFQGIKADLAAERLGPDAAPDVRFVGKLEGVQRLDTPHGLLTALHVKDMLMAWGTDVVVAGEIAVTLGGHHGYFPKGSAVGQARQACNDHGGEKWAGWRDEMVLQVADCLGLPDPRTLPWSEVGFDVVAAIGLAGLTTVSDWIASDESNYESPDEPVDLAEYVRVARPRAVRAVVKAGMQRWVPPSDTSFMGLNPDASDVRPVQVLAERLVAYRRGPTMVVVEAPTGEGKTLLAFQVAATLVRDLGLSGVYTGMPTKATSNQVLAEFEALLKRVGDTTGVRLVHSDAGAHLAERDTEPSDVGRDDPESDDVATREWFTRKKSLLASLGVGTVDQVVRAGIRSGHGFVRLAGLSGKVVVFDEVHAYDTHMSTLLDRLLMWLGRLGVSVVVLSATLPTRRRDELARAWRAGVMGSRPGNVAAMPACDGYPRVTVVDQHGATARKAGTSKINQKRDVVLRLVAADQVVPWLLDQSHGGRGVAAVHNTVSRAKQTYDEVRAAVARLPQDRFPGGERPVVKLIHGQMDRTERREVEAWLRSEFGPDGGRTPAIVVGTQVLEQSLDLDFDAMLTDLAPVDLVIQRAGRVHRHNREDRGPLLLGITGVSDTPGGAPAFPPRVPSVYSRFILLRTWALLRHRETIHCPQEIPKLVDAVYGPQDAVACPPGWETEWRKAEAADRAQRERKVDRAANLYLPVPVGEAILEKLSEQPQDPRRTREDKGRR